nr:hypothetical protein [uncultured Allomuricauda sp.]
MKTDSSIIWFIFLVVLVTSCKSSNLNKRKEITHTRSDGKTVKCYQPPADVTVTGTDLNFSAIKSHINAIASVTTKISRIREEIPGINSIEAIEFRMCNAYGNNIIDSKTYNKFVGQILPALEIINQPKVSNNNIGENYMRLFGALEAPIIMRLITGKSKGYELNEVGVISDWKVDESTGDIIGDDEDCKYCRGHIDSSIIDFWKEKWEYSDILPLNTNLWQSIVDDIGYDLDLFWTASITDESDFSKRRNAWCFVDEIWPWEISRITRDWVINSDSGENLCNKDVSKDIGFLYLILENFSEHRLDDIELFYKNISNSSVKLLKMPVNPHFAEEFEKSIDSFPKRTEYLNSIGLAIDTEEKLRNSEEKKLFLPKMLPKQSFIWVLSVYFKDDIGYPKSYLSDITKPLKVKYKINGKEYTEILREPGKDKSIKINLPLGWYGQ